MQLQGWGRYPNLNSEILEPTSTQAVTEFLSNHKDPLIPRGAGRSYGDS